MRKTTFLPLVLVLALVGCKRPQPSEAYTKASADFTHLYAQKLDDAFGDPQMAEIAGRLGTVPQDSLDYQAAQQLLQRINAGKAAYEEREAARKKAIEAPPPPMADFPSPSKQERQVEAAPDAGATSSAQPTTGMSIEEFQKRFSNCFKLGGPIQVQGVGMKDTYVMQDFNFCKDEHPGFDQNIIVADGTKILGVYAKSAVQYTPQPAPTPAPTPTEGQPAAGDAGV